MRPHRFAHSRFARDDKPWLRARVAALTRTPLGMTIGLFR